MKENEIAIKVENVSMHFNMASEKTDNLKEYVVKMLKHQLFFKDFVAVDNISFEVKKGEVFGIVGTNGSGKSTLLKMVSGILEPTMGKITTYGKIAPLIELGAGFDGELTARENIFLNGAVLGFEKDFLEEKFTDIVDFAELWDFLDMPIKNYSSGMVARIAFAIATVVKPEILIVDEILAVGDFLFQQKCEKRIKELMAGGTTVLIVSHSIDQVEKLCDRVLWIEKSKPKMIGNTFEVCNAYRNLQNSDKQQALHEYHVVAEEKCHICGEITKFRNEPGMTYHTESFCSCCGGMLRNSDLVNYYLEKTLKKQNSSIQECKDYFEDKNMLICASKGTLYNFFKGYSGFIGLEGNVHDWCEQLKNIDKLQIKENTLDFIIFEEILICVEEPLSLLENLKKLLKPGGVLMLYVPVYENIKTQFRKKKKNNLFRNGVVIHTQWGMDTEKLLEDCGYMVEKKCFHKWYGEDEIANPDKEYDKYISTHPYYYYKFNSWIFYAKKEK